MKISTFFEQKLERAEWGLKSMANHKKMIEAEIARLEKELAVVMRRADEFEKCRMKCIKMIAAENACKG